MTVPEERQRRLQGRIVEGDEAEKLLSNPLLVQAFREVEEQYIKLWAATPSAETNRREELYYALNGLRDFRAKLSSAIKGSQIANMELAQIEKSSLEEAIYG